MKFGDYGLSILRTQNAFQGGDKLKLLAALWDELQGEV
jgi:hypothetical protein